MAEPCPHCPDGHAAPHTRPWAVWVSAARDGDRQPMYLIACPTDGAHVAEADAEWLRELVNDGLGAIQHQRIARLHKRTAEQIAADLEELKADTTRTTRASLLAYGTHKPGCGGLTSTTGRACECGWIQVRDLAKEASDG